jgi:hypothetical protein
LFFNESCDILGGEAPAFADFTSAHVDEPDAPEADMLHENFHGDFELCSCFLGSKERFVGHDTTSNLGGCVLPFDAHVQISRELRTSP